MFELQELREALDPRELVSSSPLLERLSLAPDDPALWSEFIKLYSGTIFRWCQRWGLQYADAQDVTQEVFLRLTVRMQSFRHDPQRSFRGWLKTVTQHECQHYIAKKRKAGQACGGESGVTQIVGTHWLAATRSACTRARRGARSCAINRAPLRGYPTGRG
jgi:DNA-directed RNA polymerase specialized sigma24 family protein